MGEGIGGAKLKKTQDKNSLISEYGICLWSIQANSLGYVPSQTQPTHFKGRVKNIEGLDAVQALLDNSQSTVVLSVLFYLQIQNCTKQAAGKEVNSIPTRSSTKSLRFYNLVSSCISIQGLVRLNS